MLSVGYDMYLKLLEEAVLTQQGQPVPKRTECAADLAVAASIPDRYVPAPEQRMDLYRRIAAIRSEEEADDLVDELIDRYGEPPRTVNNLISVALLRAAAAEADITDIAQKNGQLIFTLEQFRLEPFSLLCGGGALSEPPAPHPGDVPRFTLRLRKGATRSAVPRTWWRTMPGPTGRQTEKKFHNFRASVWKTPALRERGGCTHGS